MRRLQWAFLFAFLLDGVELGAQQFIYPLTSWKQTCNFTEYCWAPNHLGDDAVPGDGSAVVDSLVVSPADGIVKETKVHKGYGGVVIIEANSDVGLVTIVLGHLRHLKSGDFLVTPSPNIIPKGTPLGRIAPTGENGGAYKPHSHIGIHKGPYGSINIDCAMNKEWVYAGYTNCPDVVFPTWYDPSDFIQARLGPSNAKPIGSLDGVNSLNQVSGWSRDPDNPNAAVTVHLYIDKNAGTAGGAPIAITANQFRSDVGNHAFNWDIPVNIRDGQTHTVWAWGIDLTDPTGNNALLPGSPKTFNIAPSNPPPTAGFTGFSGNQTKTDGQTLNLTVPTGGSTSVSFDASSRSSAANGGTITGWQWLINGSLAATTSTFSHAFMVGTSTVSLVVTDNRGAQSQPVVATIVVTQASFPTTWTLESSNSAPSPRQSPIVADTARSQLLLFGGRSLTGGPNLGDTWTWNGNIWSIASPLASPPTMSGHTMAYDEGHAQVVLLSTRGETWLWNGITWSQAFPVHHPSSGGPMAYDSIRSEVILYQVESVSMKYTWGWNGTDWIQKIPTTSPNALGQYALAYDSFRGQVVLFGGNVASSTSFTGAAKINETWTWDGTTWSQRFPTNSPPPRSQHSMSFDVSKGVVVMAGGFTDLGTLGDTWLWDGATWISADTGQNIGSPVIGLAYDAARNQTVLFQPSGVAPCCNFTWIWGP